MKQTINRHKPAAAAVSVGGGQSSNSSSTMSSSTSKQKHARNNATALANANLLLCLHGISSGGDDDDDYDEENNDDGDDDGMNDDGDKDEDEDEDEDECDDENQTQFYKNHAGGGGGYVYRVDAGQRKGEGDNLLIGSGESECGTSETNQCATAAASKACSPRAATPSAPAPALAPTLLAAAMLSAAAQIADADSPFSSVDDSSYRRNNSPKLALANTTDYGHTKNSNLNSATTNNSQKKQQHKLEVISGNSLKVMTELTSSKRKACDATGYTSSQRGVPIVVGQHHSAAQTKKCKQMSSSDTIDTKRKSKTKSVTSGIQSRGNSGSGTMKQAINIDNDCDITVKLQKYIDNVSRIKITSKSDTNVIRKKLNAFESHLKQLDLELERLDAEEARLLADNKSLMERCRALSKRHGNLKSQVDISLEACLNNNNNYQFDDDLVDEAKQSLRDKDNDRIQVADDHGFGEGELNSNSGSEQYDKDATIGRSEQQQLLTTDNAIRDVLAKVSSAS